MTMPHITTQMWSTPMKHDDGRTCIPKMLSEVPNRAISVGLRTYEQQQSDDAAAATCSPSTVSNQSPRKRKFNILLTPTSIASAVFDTPIKPSPSSFLSSVDSTQSFDVIKRGATPVAELEDTSHGLSVCSELEDTSAHAMGSPNRKTGALTLKSHHPTSQALILAVDRQFADYEEEIRQLRRDLNWKEESVVLEQKAKAEAQDALIAAKRAIAEQNLVIEQLALLNLELKKEVIHCQKHHLPPPTPSKSRDLEVPLSLFNIDKSRTSLPTITPKSTHAALFPERGNVSGLERAQKTSQKTPSLYFNKNSKPTHVSASFTLGSPSINNRQTVSKPCSPSSKNSSPKSLAAAASPIAKSPSAAGSPYIRPLNPIYNFTPPEEYVPLTNEALCAANSSVSVCNHVTNISETHQFTPLGYISSAESKNSNMINPNESQRPKSKNSRPGRLRSHSSSPSVHLSGPISPYSYVPHVPPMPAMMRGGLAVPLTPPAEQLQGEEQEHTLRKKLGELGNGLSDLFRAKEVKDALVLK